MQEWNHLHQEQVQASPELWYGPMLKKEEEDRCTNKSVLLENQIAVRLSVTESLHKCVEERVVGSKMIVD